MCRGVCIVFFSSAKEYSFVNRGGHVSQMPQVSKRRYSCGIFAVLSFRTATLDALWSNRIILGAIQQAKNPAILRRTLVTSIDIQHRHNRKRKANEEFEVIVWACAKNDLKS